MNIANEQSDIKQIKCDELNKKHFFSKYFLSKVNKNQTKVKLNLLSKAKLVGLKKVIETYNVP